MHQNGLPNKVWLRLGTEGVLLRNLVSDINVGDLPPKSPEFYEMLPSLRSSPIFLFQAREDENSDSFHVVPSFSKTTEASCTADTYESFLRNLESNDNQEYREALPLSPECHQWTKQIVEDENSENLCDDFQIYLQNEISPTPIDKLYSTLPMKEATKTFEFPAFDENQRLENMENETRNIEYKTNDYQETFSQNKDFVPTESRPSRKRKVLEQSAKPDAESSQNIKGSKRSVPRANRPSHNDIERQRRNDMKARFDGLKAVIPEIEKLERTPKIQILSRAAEYISKLHEDEKRLDIEKELERKRNRLLLDKLVQLTKL